MKYIILLITILIAGCAPQVEGVYEKVTNKNPYFGWKKLEFKSNNLLLINGGEFTSSYKVEGTKISMSAGIMTAYGEIQGDKIVTNGETFVKLIKESNIEKFINTLVTSLNSNQKNYSIEACKTCGYGVAILVEESGSLSVMQQASKKLTDSQILEDLPTKNRYLDKFQAWDKKWRIDIGRFETPEEADAFALKLKNFGVNVYSMALGG